MNRWTRWLTSGAGILALAVVGCVQAPVSSGDLDTLTDTNNNGFNDVTPPDGVVFDDATNAKVRLSNTINQDDLAGLAQQQGIDPAALNLVTLQADIVMTLDYRGFETITVRQSESLAPFERTLEAACPDAISVDVTVVANVPLVGPQTVFTQVFVLNQGTEYACGATLNVRTFVDDNGFPQVDIAAE